jgi:hypothetical protein
MCGALRVLDRILGAWLMPFELKVSGSSQQQTSVQRPASVAEGGKRKFAALASQSGLLEEGGRSRLRWGTF